jgi:hypothetical protein
MLALAILIAVACGVREHWSRLRNDDPGWNAVLRRWFVQGVIVPVAAWGITNLGVSSRFPALIPQIAIAQASNQAWFSFWVTALVRGAGLVVICWGAVTYLWMIFVIARDSELADTLRSAVRIVGIPMFLLALLLVYRATWTVLPMAVLVVLMPVVHRALVAVEAPPPVPMYGAARGKIHSGKYEAAEIEVINQLEKKENDFNGWMMLAELYATKYRRLEDAAQVVVDICRDPTIADIEASVACNKLADWQLEIGMNPPAARAALDLLIQRAPGSHVAEMARVRLKQIPRTRDDLLDQRKPKSIRLPALREDFAPPAADNSSKNEATAEANRLSDRLRYDPNDFGARERLAILLAEKLGQVNAGIEQLRLLINMPESQGEPAAKWLAQIATWERYLNKNEQKFRAILNEIILDYPNTTYALSARRQFRLIEDAELQKTTASETPPVSSIRLQVPKL